MGFHFQLIKTFLSVISLLLFTVIGSWMETERENKLLPNKLNFVRISLHIPYQM